MKEAGAKESLAIVDYDGRGQQGRGIVLIMKIKPRLSGCRPSEGLPELLHH
jgi:hypothetical protein